jgi:hypothetical protein
MVNYENSKVYKIEPIVDHPEEYIYIGSTTKKYLSQRMDTHRTDYKRWKNGKHPSKLTVYNLFDKYGIENCQILLLESVNANSKDELHSREAYYIRTLKCVNKVIPGRKKKQYDIDNKDKIKEYYDSNKRKISEKRKNKIHCDICNCEFRKADITKHNKTIKHQNNLNNQK